MSRWSYGQDTGRRPRVQVRQPDVRPAVRSPGRDDEPRPCPEVPRTQSDLPRPSPPPAPEPLRQHEVIELRDADLPRHRGRREDDRRRDDRPEPSSGRTGNSRLAISAGSSDRPTLDGSLKIEQAHAAGIALRADVATKKNQRTPACGRLQRRGNAGGG